MKIRKETALVYCDKQFGLADGKTAAGLVRHSEIYRIVGVIDSALAGKDAGEALGEEKSDIPIFADLDDALSQLPKVPDCYIYGKAPLETYLSADERLLILAAMERGMDIINGLHQFFSEDAEFAARAAQANVQIKDIRKPPQLSDLHVFTGQISDINVPVVAILGTDCACGKMTTAIELNQALNNLGIRSVLVATGQTSLMQGARYGVSIDALVSQFVIGEIEHSIIQAAAVESPDIILVEGQSAVSHPAFMSSLGILKGSMPDGVILQHPPARKFRCDFSHLAMPTVESEIELIEAISQTSVIAIALSHENLTAEEILDIVEEYEHRLQLPTADVLSHGCQKLVQTLLRHFPKLNPEISSTLKQPISEKIPVLGTR
ncbi:DUF1611 domain-containing protein [Romeria aff. gracilis LEGE 07310]|uniref:DUF1611 domain-containing protein n=1 Tax=Vasconcelosia minhoensis LEGE 07310 TaxID=915328 RepID=A0A8J7AB43_9CYAN|nr:DUF1611 domain-containing protein [Romeria gracilis]MBE9079630.1 DUF1611 domain-containing protein [Romeria aff. gracilis LEGE 07310]